MSRVVQGIKIPRGLQVYETYPEKEKLWVDSALTERDSIIDLLKQNSKCKLDGGHDTKGYCFCEAINLIEERYHGAN